MKIAVVTPVYKTPRPWLEQCLASVRAESVPCTHFLVNDGDDSLAASDFAGVEFITLLEPHRDCGNWARGIGSEFAIVRDFDAIAYLDADNWYEADHLQEMVALHQRTGAAVCTAARYLVDLEGRLLGRCPEVDGDKFVDTSCLFLTRAAFDLVNIWCRMPRESGAVGDRVLWKAVKEGSYSRAHRDVPTVNYRTNYHAHYVYFGKTPPPGAKHVEVRMSPIGQFISVQTSVLEANPPVSPPNRLTPVQGLTPTPGSLARERVSLCMIVKNEEKNLPPCLGPVASLFDEIIVVDTGSTDQTKASARHLGAKVFDFAWLDSFAAARNESLQHATGEWIFWLDADERIDESNVQKLRRLLNELPKENHAYMMCQRSTADPLTGAVFVVDQVRLFRKLPGVAWRYRCHEQIFMALKEQGAREVRTDVVIGHLGYEEPTLHRRKRQRNLRLLQQELEENPREPFVLFNLANATIEEGRVAEALRYLQDCLENAPVEASYLPKAYRLLSGAYHLLGHKDEALHSCQEGKKQSPLAVELWFQEGILLLARGDLIGARHCFETILKLPPQQNHSGADATLAGCRTRYNLAFIYKQLGLVRQAEEQWQVVTLEHPEFEPSWLALMELYLEQNRQADAAGLLLRVEGKVYPRAIQPALQARLALARGDLASARRTLEDALLRAPHLLWLRHLLADILIRVAGDAAAAETHLRAILSLSPNDVQARRKLAELDARR